MYFVVVGFFVVTSSPTSTVSCFGGVLKSDGIPLKGLSHSRSRCLPLLTSSSASRGIVPRS